MTELCNDCGAPVLDDEHVCLPVTPRQSTRARLAELNQDVVPKATRDARVLSRPETTPPPHPQSALAKSSFTIKGQVTDHGKLLIELADDGAELYAMVGLAQHGKSEFMWSMLNELTRRMGGGLADQVRDLLDGSSMIRTPPGEYFAWRMRVGSRTIVFWDIAGDDFIKLQLDFGLVEPDLNRLLRTVLPRCSGIAMTISVPRLWGAWNPGVFKKITDEKRVRYQSVVPETQDLEKAGRDIADNLAIYTRFLEFARLARDRPSKRMKSTEDFFTASALASALKHAPLLDIPVFVNLSMADVCHELMAPNTDATHIPGQGIIRSELVDVSGSDPLAFSFVYLNSLHNNLCEQVRWFKVDFSHAFDRDTRDHEHVRVARGARSAFDFLVMMDWRGRWLSTGRMLRLYRTFRKTKWDERVQACLIQTAARKGAPVAAAGA